MAFWDKKRKGNDNLEDIIAKKIVEASERPDFQSKLKAQVEKRNAIFSGQRPDADDYGYSPSNPICTSTIEYSSKYLSRLLTEKGEKLYWIRIDSFDLEECNGVSGVIVDHYFLYLNGSKYAEIYICPYAHNCSYTPKGMLLAEESDIPKGNGNLSQESRASGMSVEQFLKFQQLQYEDKRIQQQQKESARKELEVKAVQVQKSYTQFNLDLALQDETFVALLKCGVEMKVAYEYIQRAILFSACPSQTTSAHRLTSSDCYKIMYEFECAAREHFIMPSSDADIKKEAIELGISVPQILQLYKLKIANSERKWKQLQEHMTQWADEAVSVQYKYPEFDLKHEYADEMFRRILMHTTVMTAYEVVHFQELYKPIARDKSDVANYATLVDTNQAYISIFANIYDKALSVLSVQSLVRNAEFELLPAMFVIADYSCLSSNKNRKLIGKELRTFVTRKYRLDNINDQLFNNRVNFYGSIIRGKSLRADWLPNLQTIQNADAIVRCATALGDILINPACANDYENAPILLYDIFSLTSFADIYINKIIPLFVELFKEIYDL